MPMVATALEKMIATKLANMSIAVAPKETAVTSTPAADGTVSVSSTPGATSAVYMDKGTVNAIAAAVAESVVTFLKTNAVATGPNSGGTLVLKIT